MKKKKKNSSSIYNSLSLHSFANKLVLFVYCCRAISPIDINIFTIDFQKMAITIVKSTPQ